MTRFIDIIPSVFNVLHLESNHENIEAVPKKPEKTETVERLISKKKAERAQEGIQEVQESAEGIQTEVADVMAGVEGPKEKVSEKKGESGEKGDIKAGAAQGDGDQGAQPVTSGLMRRKLPTQEIMIKKIRTAINAQIALEIKKAKHLQKNITVGSAQEYNSTIARIRRLKETLSSLATGAFEVIKKLYFKYFTSDGHRKT